VYRAVGEEELRDIVAKGRFAAGSNSLAGKWFADSLADASAHATALYPDGDYALIEADVPDDAPSLFRLPNLDNRGPARYLHVDDLADVIPRPLARRGDLP